MRDDLEDARLDADKRYNDALTALDRAVNNAAARDGISQDAAAAIGTALLVFLQQITAFVDTKDRELTARLAVGSEVVDGGCGGGEFLDLLRKDGVRARGVDKNKERVAAARRRGVAAVEADALAYVSSFPAGSLGGLIAAQVVEHLEPPYL